MERSPSATGVDRSATDPPLERVRFAWDRIWGSNVYGTLTSREVELDEERSGQQYDLTHGTHYASMLSRNGKVHDLAPSTSSTSAATSCWSPAFLYKEARLTGVRRASRTPVCS